MKKNKKGFTLIELLAVIVILAVLITVSVPSITKYLDKSRKDTFKINVKGAINAISTDVMKSGVVTTKTYTLSQINDLLDKKLIKSSYGNSYDTTSYVKVTMNNNTPTYEICIMDNNGNGVYKSTNANSIQTGINTRCGAASQLPKVAWVGVFTEPGATTLTDGTTLAYGLLTEALIIPASDTVDGNQITIEYNSSLPVNMLLTKYDSNNKVEWAFNSISINASQYDNNLWIEDFNGTSDDWIIKYELENSEYILSGATFSEGITIPASNTINNTAMTLTNTAGNLKNFIIKFNTDDKAKWIYELPVQLENGNALSIDEDKYLFSGVATSSTITIPADKTVNNQEITIENINAHASIILQLE